MIVRIELAWVEGKRGSFGRFREKLYCIRRISCEVRTCEEVDGTAPAPLRWMCTRAISTAQRRDWLFAAAHLLFKDTAHHYIKS